MVLLPASGNNVHWFAQREHRDRRRNQLDLLFFSRGRGRGHAIPDIAIMEALRALDDKVNWQFVSYGTGASTLSEFGYDVVDLELPDENPFFETGIRASGVIRRLSPRLVVSHEEFAALTAARIHTLPAIFITDWFMDENDMRMQTLASVEGVLFLGDQGVFDEPSYLEQKVEYIGPVVRDFEYHIQDRERARQELGMGEDITVVAVLPGGWATEKRAPLFDLLLPAFLELKMAKKLLFWVAGDDCEKLMNRTKGIPEVRIVKKLWPIEQLMVASDLVVTKGNRVTVMEASQLGVRSISLSYGMNPVEDLIVPRIKTNEVLGIRGITSSLLASRMEHVLRSRDRVRTPERTAPRAASVAKILLVTMAKLGILYR